MTAAPTLQVRVRRRVHPGLLVEVAFELGAERGVVFGPSGAGKSTLLRLIAGLDRPDHGRVVLGGEVLFDSDRAIDLPLRRRGLGMVFQHDLLFPHLCVVDNIRFGLRGTPARARDDRVEEVAALVGVAHLLDRRPATLSGGERQRVGLARALAPRPRLLLCDEPVSALDLANRHLLVERLRAIQEAERIPVLYVTHGPAEAVALGDHLFLLEAGRLVAQGPPIDVLARAPSAGPRPLEGVANRFRARVEAHDPAGATLVRLENGPSLVVPRADRAVGALLLVEVLAEEVLLARGPVEGLSARNVIPGRVERVLSHGSDAEVFVRTGGVSWFVSVVEPAIAALGLEPGADVHLVVKARSCRVHAPVVGEASS